MGGAGKAGLLGYRTDGKLSRFQQLLGRFDAAVVDVIHDGLARYPPEQTAQVVGRKIKLRRHLGEGKLLPVIGRKVGADLLHRFVVGTRHGAALGNALLLHIVQDQQQVQRAGVILLGAGAGHHFQQGTDAALPLHRCIQHCALPGRKQAAEIPPGCVFQIMQHPQWKVAPHDLRHGAAGLCKAAAAGAKQHGAAGVYQYALTA